MTVGIEKKKKKTGGCRTEHNNKAGFKYQELEQNQEHGKTW